jgi:hypothetical protein
MTRKRLVSLLAVAVFFGLATADADTTFSGTLYYTNYSGGGDNVNQNNVQLRPRHPSANSWRADGHYDYPRGRWHHF